MGAIDWVLKKVNRKGIMPTESTEVFSIHLSSNNSLNKQRDEESQRPLERVRKNRRWLWHVTLDLPIIVAVLVLLLLFEFSVLPSYQSGFYCNDLALDFPFRGDTVSMAALVTTLFLLPPIMILLTELILNCRNRLTRSNVRMSSIVTGLIMRDYYYGFLLNLLIVELLKGLTGFPRPTFFALCQPDAAKTCNGSEYVSSFTCTSTEHSDWLQKDSYHSFPSGHTSLSVYAGFFVAWYLQVRAFKWSNKSAFVVPLVQVLCVAYAAVCSVTRITDHRHHWWDVLVGAVIGFATLYFAVSVISKKFACTSRTFCYENGNSQITSAPSTNRPSSESLLRNGPLPSVIVS